MATMSRAAAAPSSPSALSFFNKAPAAEEAVEEDDDDDDNGSWTDFGTDPLSYGYAGLWAGLLTFSFVLAPGELSSASDTAMLQSILANPSAPDMNSFYYGIFNEFALIPIVWRA